MNRTRRSRWIMRAIAVVSAITVFTLLVTACGGDSSSQTPFRDYGYAPPASEYDGPHFKLSQDYPTNMPDSSALPEFFKTNFRKDWRTYMLQVRDYCFAGNVDTDWRVEKNTVRKWYHMPWQDAGTSGREAIHGLTQEAPLSPGQLAATQTYPHAVAYAVGFYNDFGGYTIGRVWKDHEKPDPGVTSSDGFPIGTVVCKTLFVDMPPSLIAAQIPYLAKNPIEWQAFTINSDPPPDPGIPNPPRSVKEVTLIQMDIMIRDDRAPYGWIFGTFQYNGALAKNPAWNNLVPVGLMWDNDPDYPQNTQNIPLTDAQGNFPPNPPVTETPRNPDLAGTVINPDATELPPTHLGWGGRLNGPVDNPRSSCMSCHMTASHKGEPLSPLFITDAAVRPTPGSAEWNQWWMQWFQNVGWQNGQLEKFVQTVSPPPGYVPPEDSLDFSLQLSAALQNFYANQPQPETPENPVRR